MGKYDILPVLAALPVTHPTLFNLPYLLLLLSLLLLLIELFIDADETSTILSTTLLTARSDLDTPIELNQSDASRETALNTSGSTYYTISEGIN